MTDLAHVDEESAHAGEDFDAYFRRTYARWKRVAVGVALVQAWDLGDAEEALMDAFKALWEQWTRVRCPDAWMAQALRIQLRNHRRRWFRRPDVSAELEEQITARGAAVPDVADAAYVRQVLQEISRLPWRQGQVMVGCGLLGMTQQEVAEILGIQRGTVAPTLRNARAALARRVGLGEVEPDEGAGLMTGPKVPHGSASPVVDPLTDLLDQAKRWIVAACETDEDELERRLTEIHRAAGRRADREAGAGGGDEYP